MSEVSETMRRFQANEVAREEEPEPQMTAVDMVTQTVNTKIPARITEINSLQATLVRQLDVFGMNEPESDRVTSIYELTVQLARTLRDCAIDLGTIYGDQATMLQTGVPVNSEVGLVLPDRYSARDFLDTVRDNGIDLASDTARPTQQQVREELIKRTSALVQEHEQRFDNASKNEQLVSKAWLKHAREVADVAATSCFNAGSKLAKAISQMEADGKPLPAIYTTIAKSAQLAGKALSGAMNGWPRVDGTVFDVASSLEEIIEGEQSNGKPMEVMIGDACHPLSTADLRGILETFVGTSVVEIKTPNDSVLFTFRTSEHEYHIEAFKRNRPDIGLLIILSVEPIDSQIARRELMRYSPTLVVHVRNMLRLIVAHEVAAANMQVETADPINDSEHVIAKIVRLARTVGGQVRDYATREIKDEYDRTHIVRDCGNLLKAANAAAEWLAANILIDPDPDETQRTGDPAQTRAVFNCAKCGKRVTVNSVICDTCTANEVPEAPEKREADPRVGQRRMIKLTETTVRELMRAIENAHADHQAVDGTGTTITSIIVDSPVKVDAFEISLDFGNMQESCGYMTSSHGLPPAEPGKEQLESNDDEVMP